MTIEAHVIGCLLSGTIGQIPWPHMQVTEVFPEQFYQEMIANLPPLECYKESKHYPKRYITELNRLPAFWQQFDWMLKDKFRNEVFYKFSYKPEGNYRADLRLVRDVTGYSVGPHTDSPSKLFSLLFYLSGETGTSLYEPIDPDLTCIGNDHHDFTSFRRIKTVPFIPNSLFVFPKTGKSFHGVEPTTSERNILLYNIYRMP